MVVTVFTVGIAYSAFSSDASINTVDQKIAKFVFDAKTKDSINLPLTDLKPNSSNVYQFSVTNSQENVVSNVTIEYQISVKTFHFIPLEIKLFKEGSGEAILNCDETFSRNSENVLVCNSPIEEFQFDKKKLNDYRLEVNFPSQYNGEEYADLVDFIDIDIKSWQKDV